ncbi:MAG: glucose/sorbosone dehydrogenase [Pleurocapsa sp. SU_196_0]|nr:glucose/sorbosone dehydrogenase [Pleurocapsa sp. SU_196_0]
MPRAVRLEDGRAFTLSVAANWELRVAAQGLKRVRFMARSPDGRVFVTDMFDRTDNTKGAVYILSDFNAKTGRFASRVTYLSGLRNPNSLAFHTDKQGQDWLYLALTDKLVRYRFSRGETKPSSTPQTLARFPDYGLSYKYGGWHLTRTVTIGPDERVYVAVGSSCNACVEKEAVRASVIVMNLDGSSQRRFVSGLRNAVGLKFVGQTLYATNMGADHLGDDAPNDQLYALEDRRDYGWPYCFVKGTKAITDPKYNPGGKLRDCSKVPASTAALPAHSAPLGLEYFDASSVPDLRDSFLVALHGSGFIRIGTGYAVWRVGRDGTMTPFMTGFLKNKTILGRPVDVLRYGDGFLVTDDYAGVVYHLKSMPR